MKRVIKFRGYNVKNKEWLYGFYLQNRGLHFVCPDEFADGKGWDDYEVDLDTVGQFTGLHDKNGNEIYEGDIVKIRRTPKGRRLSVPVRHIVTCESVCNWYFEPLTSNVIALSMTNQCEFDGYKFEVIGNIYDNSATLDTHIIDCGLSIRVANLCIANNIITLRDLVKLHKTDWLKFRNGGYKSLHELDELLKKNNLNWAEYESDKTL